MFPLFVLAITRRREHDRRVQIEETFVRYFPRPFGTAAFAGWRAGLNNAQVTLAYSDDDYYRRSSIPGDKFSVSALV
ncbi:hypothetical protein E4U22_004162, partial [Claviceps purpurea]